MIVLAGGNIAAVRAATPEQSEEETVTTADNPQEEAIRSDREIEQLPEDEQEAFYQKRQKTIYEETGGVTLPEASPMVDFCARPAACEEALDNGD